MKKKLLIGLLTALCFSTALAQPLTDKKTLTIHFKPVFVQEVVEEGHVEGNKLYSQTVKLTWGLKVE